MGTDVVILLKKYFFLILFLLSFNIYSTNSNKFFLKETLSKIVSLAKDFNEEQQKAAKIISDYFSKESKEDFDIGKEKTLFFYQLIKYNDTMILDGKEVLIAKILIDRFNFFNSLADKDKNKKDLINLLIKKIIENSSSLKNTTNDIFYLVLEKKEITIDDINSLIYKDKKGVDVLFEVNATVDLYILKTLFFKLLKNTKKDDAIKSEHLKISLKCPSWFGLFYMRETFFEKFIINNKMQNILITRYFFEELSDEIKKNYKHFEDFVEFNKKNHFIFDLFLIIKSEDGTSRTFKDFLFQYYSSDLLEKIIEEFRKSMMKLHDENNIKKPNINNLLKNVISNAEKEIEKINDNEKIGKIEEFFSDNKFKYNIQNIRMLFFTTNNKLRELFKLKLTLQIKDLKNQYVLNFNNAKVFLKKEMLNHIEKNNFFDSFNLLKDKIFEEAPKKEKQSFQAVDKIYEESFEEFFKGLDDSVKEYTTKYNNLYCKIFDEIFKHKNEKLLVYFLIKNQKISFNKKTSKKDIKKIIDEYVSSLNIYSDNNNILNLLENENLSVSDIDKLVFENYKGIDVLLHSFDYLKFYIANILFYSIINNKNSDDNTKLYSSILDINLSLKSWQNIVSLQNSIINCLSMHNYKMFFPMENSLTEEIFNSIVNKYATLEEFLEFDEKNNLFFDTYILNLEETSLRKKLIYYYLEKENEELIKKINNKKCSELNELENKLDNFLSKINYDKKTSLIFKKPKSKSELLYNLTMNDQLIIEDYYKSVTGYEKSSRIIKIELQEKIKEDKKQTAKPQITGVQKQVKETKKEAKETKKEEQQQKSNKNVSNTKIFGRAISDLFHNSPKKDKNKPKEEKHKKEKHKKGVLKKIKQVISNRIEQVQESATDYCLRRIRQIFTPEHIFKKIHRNNIEFLINASNQPFEEYQAQVKEISKNIYEELTSIEHLIYLLGEDAYLTNSESFYTMKTERETTITQALNLIDLMNDPDAPSSIDKSVQNLTQQIIYNLNSLKHEQACFYNFIHTNEHLGSIKIFLFDPDLVNKPLEEIAAIFDLARNEIKQKRLIIDNIMPYKYRIDNYYAAIVYAYNELVKINKAFFL